MGTIERMHGMMQALLGKAAAASIALSLVSGAAHAAEYSLVYISLTKWSDINNNNVAVGSTSYFYLPKPVIAATMWKNGVATDFSLGYSQASATGINDAGVIVGSAFGTLPNGAFRYSGGGALQDATFLGAVQPDQFARPAAINNLGAVAGVSGIVETAFATSPGGAITPLSGLGTLGGPRSGATGINDAGVVVGWADTSIFMFGQPLRQAFVYDGVMHGLGTLSPFQNASSIATGINKFGAIVGFSDTGSGRTAFLHTGTGPLQPSSALGTLGGPQSYGFGINDLGHVVGTSSIDYTGMNSHAFLYRDGKMIDLNSLVDLPPEYAGWTLISATGINNNGWIIGEMAFGANLSQGFILAPTGVVPEPHAWAMMITGFAGVGAALRRRRSAVA